MTPAADFIAIARGWLGTPWHHQASVKGVGADCVGFLKGAAVEAGVIAPEIAAQLPVDYSRQPSGQQLRRLMGGLLAPVRFPHPRPLPGGEGEEDEGEGEKTLRPGDLVLMRFAREEQHVAMLTATEPEPYIIHCGPRGVVEHRLDSVWRASITRAYRFPLQCNS